jgi:Lon protease-like protein
MQPTVQALQQALEALLGQDVKPFAEPLQWRDAGWVANRWCELLPIPLAAKQRLMELEDPTIRLQLVDEFLRSRQVFGRT